MIFGPDGPVRSCCGQHHSGIVCPDGLVMCCLCFERVPIEQLDKPEGSDFVNVCQPCRAHEIAEWDRLMGTA